MKNIFTVKNEKGDQFEVDEDKLADAEKDGFLPVVQKGSESYRVSRADFGKARADGFEPIRTSDVGMVESGLRGAAQGATFGFADEASAAIQAPFSEKTYDELVEESRQAFAAAEEANPGSYMTGNVAGALFSPANKVLGAGVAATKLGTLLPKALSNVGSLAAEGAIGSGLATVGEADSSDQIQQELDTSVGLGAGLGAAVGAAGGTLGKAGQYAAKNFEIAKYPKKALDILKNLGVDVTQELPAKNAATKMARELGDDLTDAVSTVRKTAGARLGKAKQELPAIKPQDLDKEFSSFVEKVDELPNDTKQSVFDTIENILATDKQGNKIAKINLSSNSELKFADLLETQGKLNRDIKILENKRINKEPLNREELRTLQSAKKLVDAQIDTLAKTSPEAFQAFEKANKEFAEAAFAQDYARITPDKLTPDLKSLQRKARSEVLEDKKISETARRMGEGDFNPQVLEEALTENFSRSPDLVEDILNQSLKEGPEAASAAKALETMQTFGERGRQISELDDVIARTNREGLGAGLLGKTGFTATGITTRAAVGAQKGINAFSKTPVGKTASKVYNLFDSDANLQKMAQRARAKGNESIARMAESLVNLPAASRRSAAFVLQQNPAFRQFIEDESQQEDQDEN